MGRLFLLFTVVPLVDLYLLLRIGGRIGGTATLALVLVTGALGAALARAEGTRVLRAWQQALAAGTVPADGVVSGVLVLVGGALLVTPGVLTDAVGLLLLLPATRRLIARLVIARVQRAIERGSIHVVQTRMGAPGPFPYGGGQRGPSRNDGDIIDVEGETVEPHSDERGSRRTELGPGASYKARGGSE